MSGNLHVNLYGGELAGISRYALVAGIKLAKLSGTLLFQRGKASKELLFTDGVVVGSRGNGMDDAIGTLLLKWGVITEDTHRRLQLKGKTLQIGEHLLAMKAIDRDTLDNCLREQALSRVSELFTWQDGKYMFTPGAVRSSFEPVSITEVLTAAVRYTYGFEFFNFASGMLLDTVPHENRGVPFELVAVDEPELSDMLNRVTGAVSFRGLLGPSDPVRFWQTIFVLRELECIGFDIPADLELLRKQNAAVSQDFDVRQSNLEDEAQRMDRATHLNTACQAYKKGKKQLVNGEIETAERSFYKAVTLAPNAGNFLAHLAWVRVQQNKADKTVLNRALATLKKAVEASPDSADVAYYHGGVLWLLGYHHAAHAEFDRALTLNPKHTGAKTVMERSPWEMVPPR